MAVKKSKSNGKSNARDKARAMIAGHLRDQTIDTLTGYQNYGRQMAAGAQTLGKPAEVEFYNAVVSEATALLKSLE